MTGGQRIDLLGVPKEKAAATSGADLNAAGMIRACLREGPAHGEDLRRLRMVPLRHPGFHGPRREAREDVLGVLTPHKVKLAVSGCPRNCAEATIKDLGVICVDPVTSFTSAAMAA